MDLNLARWVPAEPEHFEEARYWRNQDRAGLRTAMMLSKVQQRVFVESLVDRNAPHRYWALADAQRQEGRRTLALAGLTGIQWENALAEMSLIVPFPTPELIEQDAVDFVLREAFDRMRLLTVTAEVYQCAPDRVAFFDQQWRRYEDGQPGPVILPRRKWWDGRLWYSSHFTFTAEGYGYYRAVQSLGTTC